jgi:hypothetical protein
VIVEPRSGKRVTGILYTAADTEMTVITRDNTMIAIKQDDVRRIFHALPRSKRKARIRGVIYGTLAGFAAAAAVDSAGPSNAQDTRPGMVMVFTAIGIGSWIYKRGTKGVKKGALIYEAN